MIKQVYFTDKPYKNGFKFDNMDESEFRYINLLNASNEEIIEYSNNISEDEGTINKTALLVIDKFSFKDRKLKVIYIIKEPTDYYICFRAYLSDVYVVSSYLIRDRLYSDDFLQIARHSENDGSIPFHLLK